MDGKWVRQPRGRAGVVIFVHGILSSGETCWKHPNGTYWPTLLAEDPTLGDLGIYVYTYQTSLSSGTYSVSDVVGDLKERLKSAEAGEGTIWKGAGPMFFVCHSMGGIVARSLIVRSQVELIKLGTRVGLFLVASPSLGSSYANWLITIARAAGHTQGIALKFGQDNQWLNELDTEFQTFKESGHIPIVGRELQEDKFIVRRLMGLFPQVVPPFSAHRYFGDPLKITHSDHFSISKPADSNAIAHRALVRFLREAGERFDTLALQTLGEKPAEIAPTRPAKAVEAAAAQVEVADRKDNWPEEGGAAFVCVTERGPLRPTKVSSFQEFCAAFGSPLPVEQSYSAYAVRGFFENGGVFVVISRAAGQGACGARAAIGSSPASPGLVVSARQVGAWGNRLQVEISSATRKGLRVKVRELRAKAVATLEDFDNIPIGASPLSGLINFINHRSQWIAASEPPETGRDGTLPPLGTWQLQDGSDGIVTADSLLGTYAEPREGFDRGGLEGLRMSGHCGLACIPDLAQAWLRAEDQKRVTAALLSHCEAELATAVLAAGTPSDGLMQIEAPCDSPSAIAAWPWLSVSLGRTQQEIVVPPDGHVAGALARSDRQEGVHVRPAPCALAGVHRTEPSIVGTDAERDEFGREADRRGFNLLAMIDGEAEVFVHPLVTTSLTERNPIESRIRSFVVRRARYECMTMAFEPSSDEVKQRIRQQVEELLRRLWRAGGLGGASAEDAYQVAIEDDFSGGYELGIQLKLASNHQIYQVLRLGR